MRKERAADSPEAAVPLLLVKGKEDKELLESIIPAVEDEKAALSITAVELHHSGKSYHFRFDFNLTMVDVKMIKLLTERGPDPTVSCALHPETNVIIFTALRRASR